MIGAELVVRGSFDEKTVEFDDRLKEVAGVIGEAVANTLDAFCRQEGFPIDGDNSKAMIAEIISAAFDLFSLRHRSG